MRLEFCVLQVYIAIVPLIVYLTGFLSTFPIKAMSKKIGKKVRLEPWLAGDPNEGEITYSELSFHYAKPIWVDNSKNKWQLL